MEGPEGSSNWGRNGWARHRRILLVRMLALGLLLALIAVVAFRGGEGNKLREAKKASDVLKKTNGSSLASEGGSRRFASDPVSTPEQIVARKVGQLGRSRRAIVGRLAAHHGKEVPAEIEAFFEAVERGNWEEIDRLFQAMAKRSAQYEGSTHDESLDPFWPAVLETYGGAEQAQLWPAKQLLDYGEAILGSLKPGMVYIGGTDSGRFIPTLINETSSGEQHVVLTQNALADSRYLEYIRFLYGDRLQIPSAADAQRVFADYIADATRRLEHDEQFPDEPKQIRHNESVTRADGKVQVSGSIAVMDINERLVQQILAANPELSFALQESFPFRNTYADAAPLGPIMELRAGNTAEESGESGQRALEYWKRVKEDLLQNPESAGSSETLMAHSKMTVGHANLLAGRDPARAEEMYRLATEIFPRNTDAILGFAEFLQASGREEAARKLAEDYARRNPDLRKDLERFIGP